MENLGFSSEKSQQLQDSSKLDLRSGQSFLNTFEEQEILQNVYDKLDEIDFLMAIFKNNAKGFAEPSKLTRLKSSLPDYDELGPRKGPPIFPELLLASRVLLEVAAELQQKGNRIIPLPTDTALRKNRKTDLPRIDLGTRINFTPGFLLLLRELEQHFA